MHFNLKEAQEYARCNALNARRLENLLNTEKIVIAFKAALKVEALEEFTKYVKEGRCDEIKNWATKQYDKDLSELNVAELWQLASQYGIPFYYRLTKLELIQEITYERSNSNST